LDENGGAVLFTSAAAKQLMPLGARRMIGG
jgi:hypothetical protein